MLQVSPRTSFFNFLATGLGVAGLMIFWLIVPSARPAFARPPSFASMVTIRVGDGPISTQTLQSIGVGISFPYVGTTNFTSNNYSVNWINPNGTFMAATNYSVGFDPVSAAIGYFRGPNNPADIIVANQFMNTMSILRGSPGNSFQVLPEFSSGGTRPVTVIASDFNNDNNRDFVVLNQGSPSFAIFIGRGDGTFQPPLIIPLSSASIPVATVVGDVNGDGKSDIVVTFSPPGKSGSHGAATGSASVYLGKGDGTFQSPKNFAVGPNAIGLAAADLNGDGKLDLIIADPTANKISVLLGNGDGTFQAPKDISVPGAPGAVKAADFDGDGKIDVAVTQSGNKTVSILLGNGDGTLQPPIPFPTGNNPVSLSIGDFNGDGRPDLVVANFNDNTLSVLYNTTGCPLSNVFNATIPDGGINTPYNQNVATPAGSTYAFQVTGGTLPAGLALSTSGILSGTPTQAGTSTFTVLGLVAAGCPVTQSFSLNIHAASVNLAVAAGGASSASTPGTFSSVQVGYATVTGLAKDDLHDISVRNSLYGTAVFSVTQNGVVTSEVGVPASPPTTASRIFIDFRTGVAGKTDNVKTGSLNIDTGFAMVNRGAATAHITYTLRDMNGVTLAVGHGTLAFANHRALFIDQLNSIAPDFVLPAGFATTTQFATLEMQSDQPLSVVALRQTNNQRGDLLYTTTPVVDETLPTSSTTVYFAQLADGGGFKTIIVLVNSTGVNQTGQLKLFDNNGNPLSVTDTVSATSGSTFPYLVKANGFFVLRTDGSPSSTKVGWVQLIPDGGTTTPAGAGLFNFKPAEVLITESGVPALMPTTHARIYVDLSNGHDTGLAIGNPGPGPLSVTLKAYQSDGVTPVGATANPAAINVNGHAAAFVKELVAGLPAGFMGVLDISAPTPFVALTLRALNNSRMDFLLTTFPIADFNQPAPSPVIFPQIAEGGGFKTQFILLDTGGALNPTLNFFGDNGTPLAVGKRAP